METTYRAKLYHYTVDFIKLKGGENYGRILFIHSYQQNEW